MPNQRAHDAGRVPPKADRHRPYSKMLKGGLFWLVVLLLVFGFACAINLGRG